MTREHNRAPAREDLPEAEADRRDEPGLEPPHRPSVNQVQDQPMPASHHDPAGPAPAGPVPAGGEAADQDAAGQDPAVSGASRRSGSRRDSARQGDDGADGAEADGAEAARQDAACRVQREAVRARAGRPGR